jgi:hypothetical protein
MAGLGGGSPAAAREWGCLGKGGHIRASKSSEWSGAAHVVIFE